MKFPDREDTSVEVQYGYFDGSVAASPEDSASGERLYPDVNAVEGVTKADMASSSPSTEL